MDSISVELPGSEIQSVILDGERLKIRFSRAYLIKTMTGSAERTRWYQRGTLVMDKAAIESMPAIDWPSICLGGDIDDNLYTYRDMIPIPLESRGHIRCMLRLTDAQTPLLATGETIRLLMDDVPKYIEHIRPEA